MRKHKLIVAALASSALLLAASGGPASARGASRLALSAEVSAACGRDGCKQGNGNSALWIALGTLGAVGAGMWRLLDNPVSQ